MQRPTSVTVFGILNIVFGVLGFCCLPLSAAAFFMPHDSPVMQSNPVMQVIDTNAGYRAFLLGSIVVGMIFIIMLLIGGIGLLINKAWGRTLSLVYAYYAIASAVVGMVVNLAVLAPALAQQQAGLLVNSICGGVIGLIYPVLLLVFMYRRATIDFFSGVSTGADENTWDPGAPV